MIINKKIYALALVMAVLALFTAFPQSAAAEDVVRIGVIDLQGAINASVAGQAAKARLVARFESLQNELQSMEAEITSLQNELETQASMLSAEAKYEKEKILQRKMRDFQDMYADYTQQMQREEVENTAPIIDAILTIVSEMGAQEGYTLIIEAAKAGVIYAPDAVDITQEVVRRYDAQ